MRAGGESVSSGVFRLRLVRDALHRDGPSPRGPVTRSKPLQPGVKKCGRLRAADVNGRRRFMGEPFTSVSVVFRFIICCNASPALIGMFRLYPAPVAGGVWPAPGRSFRRSAAWLPESLSCDWRRNDSVRGKTLTTVKNAVFFGSHILTLLEFTL